jgi:hypothetical protein
MPQKRASMRTTREILRPRRAAELPLQRRATESGLRAGARMVVGLPRFRGGRDEPCHTHF